MNRFRNLATGFLLAVAVAGAQIVSVMPAHAEVSTQAVYYIRAVHSNKCITVNGWSGANGAVIDQWTCLGQANQRWNFIQTGLRFYIKSESSNKCLDGRSLTKGTTVTQWTCNGSVQQQWAFPSVDGGSKLHVGTFCGDVQGASTANGARLILWSCNNNSNQRFRLTTS